MSDLRALLPLEAQQALDRHLAECGGCQRGAGEEHAFEWTPQQGLMPCTGLGHLEIGSVVLSETLDHYLVIAILERGALRYALALPRYQALGWRDYLNEHFKDV